MSGRLTAKYPTLGPVAIVLVSLAVVLSVWMEWPYRDIPVALFVFLCPGFSFVQLLELDDGPVIITLSAALSIAILTLIAQLSLMVGVSSRESGVVAIALVCLTGAVLRACQLGSRPGVRGDAGKPS